MNTHQEKPHSFFDFRRQVVVRESSSARLSKAAKDGNIPAVKRLAKKVANIQNADPESGFTTLMYAARYGHVQLVDLLLDMGHEEEVISMDNEGMTVLMIAAIYNHQEIFYSYVTRYPECIHAINKNGWTALLYAARAGNAALVSYLLSISADIDHVDNDGNSALHHASAWGHCTVMELLVSQGCNVDLENNLHFTAADYAYSFAVQDHLKDIANILFTDESSLSLASSYKSSIVNLTNRPYPPPTSSLLSHSAFSSSVAISRGPSFPGYDSPTPRASTSSSSVAAANGIPINVSSSPRGSHFYPPTGSPSSHFN
ncbi:ankyrin repeat-containing domain protein [Fennellomyces sp. T-0311]|nr:ankyrin repeat-containing domain protein [Fennellomyces sp. T-0311]